ncbi:hypothetical protein FOZ63_020698 [Perkinsus olseni]|uniref:Uncharacterized protein n=1 Tax=Perkinsus olseni TaxID=32597 RepID=A0A7J6UD11_PEROL|nr:hypothetical protein FOZ62_014874 [Perkinsus olseni]KAF4755110.1 hypothetical protein FOZ63_020698 [Perkinsus olseni]
MSSTAKPSAGRSGNGTVEAVPDLQGLYDSPDVDDKIDETGCSESYAALEDCIVDNDRDWRKCQTELVEFRKCMKDHGRLAAEGLKIDGHERSWEMSDQSPGDSSPRTTSEETDFGTGGVAKFSPLQYSCVKRDVQAVKGLLAAGVAVDHQNAYGDSALHYAATDGDEEIILALLKHKASVNAENNYGQTPLHHAAQMGHAEACVNLIHWGADTEKRTGKGIRAIKMTKDSKTRRVIKDTKPLDPDIIRKKVEEATGSRGMPVQDRRAELLRSYSGDMLHDPVDESAEASEFTDLMYACTRKDLSAVKRIVRIDPAQVTVKNVYGDTALHYACKGTDIEMVEVLLQNCADVHARNQFGQFPIDHAAKRSPEIFSALKDYGALWDRKNKCGAPPEGMLHSSAAEDEKQPAKTVFIVQKAEVCSRTGGAGRQLFKEQRRTIGSFSSSYSSLQYACVKKDKKLFREILENEEVDVNAKNAYGDAALHYAVQGGLADVVNELIAHKADLDIQNDFGQTPLHHAAQLGHISIVKLLLEGGADRDLTTDKGKTPYALSKDVEIRRHRSPAPTETPKQESSPSQFVDGGRRKTVTRREAEVEERGMMSFSPLMYACVGGEEQKVREILREAGEKNWPELLKQQNAYGDTALHYAAQQGNRDIVSLLLDANANPDAQNRYGLTPLHQAASVTASGTSAAGRGRLAAAVEVVRELLERGADKYLEDEKGKIPLDLARHDDIKFLLLL